MPRFLHISLVLAIGLLTARPLCCCIAKAEVDPEPAAHSCCAAEPAPVSPDAVPAPCSEKEPCGECNSIEFLAISEFTPLQVAPAANPHLLFTYPPVVLHRLPTANHTEAWRPRWSHLRLDPSPPLLCVFLT